MIVTQISEASKSRCRIYIDGQFAFVLYKGELRQYHIKEEQELSAGNYREIMTKLLPKRAKLRCMNLLQSRDYTRRQLEDKLRQGDYPQECIDEAIAYVTSYGYIDDLRYARDFIEYHISSKSRMRIETDLTRKGIRSDVIRQAFAELDELGVEQDESAMIDDLLRKKHYCPDTATRQEQQRMYGFLYRRGFHADAIAKALSITDS
ncbi:MAG: recombination regulator RecX [Lachnospiraceae bacterium]|nr:recombination regulator RecX [Lachnospiraceae bacterium]